MEKVENRSSISMAEQHSANSNHIHYGNNNISNKTLRWAARGEQRRDGGWWFQALESAWLRGGHGHSVNEELGKQEKMSLARVSCSAGLWSNLPLCQTQEELTSGLFLLPLESACLANQTHFRYSPEILLSRSLWRWQVKHFCVQLVCYFQNQVLFPESLSMR